MYDKHTKERLLFLGIICALVLIVVVGIGFILGGSPMLVLAIPATALGKRKTG
jgi:hypothetical protein